MSELKSALVKPRVHGILEVLASYRSNVNWPWRPTEECPLGDRDLDCTPRRELTFSQKLEQGLSGRSILRTQIEDGCFVHKPSLVP